MWDKVKEERKARRGGKLVGAMSFWLCLCERLAKHEKSEVINKLYFQISQGIICSYLGVLLFTCLYVFMTYNIVMTSHE